MVYKILQAVIKEFLVLKRDIGGLVTLFVMPLILVIVVTLIQDSTYQAVSETSIPVIVVNEDNGNVSKTVLEQLKQSGSFEVITQIKNKKITETEAKEAVFSGDYQLAVIIPEKLSDDLNTKIDQNVQQLLGEFGMGTPDSLVSYIEIPNKEIRLYFDPAVQQNFKIGIKTAIEKLVSEIETATIYKTFEEELGTTQRLSTKEKFIHFKEIGPLASQEVMPNAVQHNVPAWTLFAIFFVIVPLSINLVKEKNQGTQVRLFTQPTPYFVQLAGKTIMYLLICLLQFYLILAVGVYLFPHLGLPHLDVSNKLFLMSSVTLAAGLAAIGLGLLLGTIADTQEQSAPFGATFVVILAALGGVWIPVFSMPWYMQYISKISPMNWALSGYYDVMLRNGGVKDVLPEMICLFLFFILFAAIALFYDKKKRSV